MVIFKYKATTPEGQIKEGSLGAPSMEIAINALQQRNLIVVSISPIDKETSFFGKKLFSSDKVKSRDVVIFSRQVSTLFEAKVSALTAFKLLSSETESEAFRRHLFEVTEDIEGGLKISQALAKHPQVFSSFYVSMVRAGEESGKLDEVFKYLADYLERSYELVGKAKKALVYPAFVIVVFIAVIVLMMVMVVPKLSEIINESGQEAPFYTKIVMLLSSLLRSYGVFILLALVAGVIFLWRYSKTKAGQIYVARWQLAIPYVGTLFRKIYLARIADNLHTLIGGGVSIIRALESTADVVDNHIYKAILEETLQAVKAGASISESFSRYEEISPLLVHMMKIGEETGKLDFILQTLANFYRKEVDRALDALVTMIEPAMTVVLGIGVGLLMAAVLVPIYNIALSI